MSRIDYSKYDNIDTDSENDYDRQLLLPLQPEEVNVDPTPSSSSTSASSGAPPWSAVTIPSDHPVFDNPVAPVPSLIEIPLAFHREGTESSDAGALDNQIASSLNIDPESGLGPPNWQSQVDTVIVARKDKKPLLPHHIEGVWMYCSEILDYFGDAGVQPRNMYSRAAFEAWWTRYCHNENGHRNGKRRRWEDIVTG
ncbi:hypothetical protein B0H63DRAFT_514994 [Podospora didyma]|uniref:Uncharacterized protein n=1 Tax=Podospora didyma TaxID=330526 RepID=A0AAE0N3T0_9PEZI|nr:hypothetical protein B0H63DRAFT_514994 [Podospora didyma]